MEALPASEANQPNILFILADDLGWNALGCYGSDWIDTPNLDQLAAEGVRFTQAYAPAPICSASRASFLTGKTPARLGFEFVTKPEASYQPVEAPLRAPRYTLDLPLEEVTTAEVLGDAGYETAFFGKWHLNQHYKRYLGWSPTHGPKNQGFQVAEEDFGSHPYGYWNDKEQRTFLDGLKDGDFPTDSMTDQAIRFLESDHEDPFFLMVSHFYIHTPNHTRLGWLHQRYLGRIPEDRRGRDALAHYAAMITTLDHHVGRLLDALDASGQANDTLVVFTSDNGADPNFLGNSPLRGSKWNLYEGGIRVPMIARWNGRTQPGFVSDQIVTGFDLMPTFADAAETEAPPDTDGLSFLPVLLGDQEEGAPRQRVWHFPYYHPETGFAKAPGEIGIDDGVTSRTLPQSAIRLGAWKLLHFYEDDRDELYNLDTDLAEQHDLSESEPSVAAELRSRLDAYLQAAGARLPEPNPDWKAPE